jgi:hypothetical protein
LFNTVRVKGRRSGGSWTDFGCGEEPGRACELAACGGERSLVFVHADSKSIETINVTVLTRLTAARDIEE